MSKNGGEARELSKEIRHLIKVAWGVVGAGTKTQCQLLDSAISRTDKLKARLVCWRAETLGRTEDQDG